MANLILIRHGDALHPAEAMIQGLLDSERPLTQLGQEQVLRSASEISKKLVQTKPLLIVSSPYVRAVQTAELIMNQLKKDNFHITEMKQNACFVPDEDSSLAVDVIGEYVDEGKNDQVIVVSHLPIISEMFSELCRRVKQDKKSSASFSTAEWKFVVL
jgi:phosphohistidine phosphatase SixA